MDQNDGEDDSRDEKQQCETESPESAEEGTGSTGMNRNELSIKVNHVNVQNMMLCDMSPQEKQVYSTLQPIGDSNIVTFRNPNQVGPLQMDSPQTLIGSKIQVSKIDLRFR